MQNISKQSLDQRVLIFPSLSSLGTSGGRIFFLFSLTQVEDILRESTVVSIPFSPGYVEGVTRWRDNVVPVISLEETLGLPIENKKALRMSRLVIVRSSEVIDGRRRRTMLRVASSIRILSLPIPCAPLSSVGWIPNGYLIRGVYRWEQGYLVVVHLENILSGQ